MRSNTLSTLGEGFILWEETMMKSDHQDPNALDNSKSWRKCCFCKFIMNFYYGRLWGRKVGCDEKIDEMLRIKLREVGLMKKYSLLWRGLELLTLMNQFIQSFATSSIQPMNLIEVLCDDYFLNQKIIKFRLGVVVQFDLLEFARSLGFNLAEALNEDDLMKTLVCQGVILLLSGAQLLRVDAKMMTLWLYVRGLLGYDKIQKNEMVAIKKARVLTDVVLRSLSAPIYCRDLDTTTLRELIDSEGRLIPEDPQPGVPRVGIPRPPRASIQDLYERMGNMEIRQEAIERIAYNPPRYAQSQYDQYYQQYPPQSPKYQQQQQDDDE
ncbi:hypothetical protein Tco_0033988 [Tanacetum coccineum]